MKEKIMKMTLKIQKAITKASILHHSQKRKGDGSPYIIHPYSVAFILAGYTNDENIIVAGLLHDVLEDVKGYTAEDMEKDFGNKITQIVKEVSEDKDPNDSKEKSKATWQKRKEKYLENLRNGSFEAMMVSCADKIHNLLSMLDAYKKRGDSMWEDFNAPTDKKIWFYREVLNILKEKLDNEIVKELEEVYLRAEKEINL